MTSLYHYKHYDLAFFPYDSSLKIRLLDPKNARCFESEFSDSDCQSLSKSLCLSSKDLFLLFQRALSSPNELLGLEVLSFGALCLRIIMQFPIEKLLEFVIPLKELELNDFRKCLYQLQDLEARMWNIETFFKKEQLKIRKNTHFPSFEAQPSSLLSVYSFGNKRKTVQKERDSEGDILEGTRIEKNDIKYFKFSFIFKGQTPILNCFLGVSFEKEFGSNRKGSFMIGSGVVYWDGVFLNSNSVIRNNEEISLIILEDEETIRWENSEGERLFEGRFNKRDLTLGLTNIRPLVSISNQGVSGSFF